MMSTNEFKNYKSESLGKTNVFPIEKKYAEKKMQTGFKVQKLKNLPKYYLKVKNELVGKS